ncbi:MAG TPA: TonB family protein [Acidobacteriaceae bacterium]
MRPVQMAVLLSSMLVSASAFAAAPKADSVATSLPVRVSTGIVAPVMLDTASFHIPADAAAASSGEVVLSLNVDEKGDARNVRIVKSASPLLDSKVVAAVLQSHFKPATLNNHVIAVDLDLKVKVQ